MAGDRRCRRHRRADQVRPPTLALTALKIAVRCRGAAFTRFQPVRIHRQTHGATGLTPLKAGLDEYPVEAFLLRLGLYQTGTRHYQRLLDPIRDPAPIGDSGSSAQVFDARIRTGADEYPVDRDIADRRTGLERHVVERAAHTIGLDRIRLLLGIRHPVGHCDDHLGRGTPGDLGLDVCRGYQHELVEGGPFIAVQCLPVGHRLFPVRRSGRKRAALHIIDSLVVDRDEPRARTGLDRHIAEGHTALHGQIPDRLAAEFNGVSGTSGRTDLRDNGQDDIFRRDTRGHRPIDRDQHRLRFLLDQTLRGQHMLDLRGADAVRQCAEGTMRGGVRITAYDRHARQRRTLFGADHVHDALARIIHSKLHDAEFGTVAVEGLDLDSRDRVCDPLAAIRGRYIMVRGGQVGPRSPYRPLREAQPLERLRRRHFVHQVTVNVQQCRAVGFLADHVRIPQFVVQRSRFHRTRPLPDAAIT